ncbi:MAG: hypothetical protein Q7R66_21550 [Undibacterium sp.]|uniref:hypothetical protein n=1 Tax=Undibacterium sp. TaxID=1914977 RepID=UPI0027194D56|nr:hypothetical protein [Undibacterium sp.]MDO8654764.1 hypothetical protein [Undibacterium sp.]
MENLGLSHKVTMTTDARSRGQVGAADIAFFAAMGRVELETLLHSERAFERTCAAILLAHFNDALTVAQLCQQLLIEKKLYTKIALCEALVKCAELSVSPLIGLLGRIGNNQEADVPSKGFYKRSYPLPRDIAARTICRLGIVAIAPLETFMESSDDLHGIAQALDAYGHIIYTMGLTHPSSSLQMLYRRYAGNALLRYKIARCLSGFRDEWSSSLLLNMLRTDHPGHQLEALRSSLLSGVTIPPDIQILLTGELGRLHAFLTTRSGGIWR